MSHYYSIAKQTVDTTRPQRKRSTQKHLEKRSGERNVDSGFQIQLEEYGSGNTRQNWMETSDLWPVSHLEWWGISQVTLLMWHAADSCCWLGLAPSASAALLSLVTGTSTVPVIALWLSGSSALCRARFPMVDRELCRAIGVAEAMGATARNDRLLQMMKSGSWVLVLVHGIWLVAREIRGEKSGS